MAKDRIFDIEKFSTYGFQALEDTTRAPISALRIMRNAQITKRGGLGPRPGTILLGALNESTKKVRGLYTFRKSLGSDEFLIKCYDDEMEFISKNYESAGWNRLRANFVPDQEFGFVTSLVNTANQDYVLGCNRYDPYFSWTGAVSELSEELVGGEIAIPVDTTLLPDIYEAKTADGSSATTLEIPDSLWAVDQWVNFYVRIGSGTEEGKIRKITGNTADTLTFDTLGADPGLADFEIRKLAYPALGTIIYNGNTISYTSIPTDDSFEVSSAHPAPEGALVTIVPTDYPGAPRGNRLTNYLGRIVVGNVRSALVRDSGGAYQGYSSAGSVFISKLSDPTDFGFSAPRVPAEGDIISMPYGGGDITDVQTQESQFYAFKGSYIEGVSYSQDANDLPNRDPLKAGIGSAGKTIRGADDIYFITGDKQFSSIGRVKLNDVKPQTLDIGNVIDRFLSRCGIDAVGRGIEIGEKVYIPLKSNEDRIDNDIVLIYNRNSRIFEGVWDLAVFAFEKWNGKYVYGESDGPNVYQMLIGHADVQGENRLPIDFEVATHYINLTASKGYQQSNMGMVVEGWIAGGASFSTKIWKDFSDSPIVTFNFAFNEEAYLDGEESSAFIGHAPLGIDPMGATLSDPDADGRRHFMFQTYYPHQYGNFFSFGFAANDADNDFEITRFGLILKEDATVNMNRIKTI
jgi:hypothetical protein